MKRMTKWTLPLCVLLLAGVVGCDAAPLQGILASQPVQDLLGQVLKSFLGAA